MRHVLVTGGAGFIGMNFIPRYVAAHEDVVVVNLDLLTYAAHESARALPAVPEHRYRFVQGDIRDFAFVRALFAEHRIDGVIHFAAESHVDNSISGPRVFVETNIVGTFNLIEAARDAWMSGPGVAKPDRAHARFHHVSTDEVFGSLGPEGAFTERTAYDPSSPYSASKAASDMLVRCYHRTYGLDVVVTNCSNNFGPFQHDEKLIPTVIRSALAGRQIPIYGDGKNVRDWLYVEDHADAIDLVFHRGVSGETYNVGSRNEVTNLELVQAICKTLDRLAPRATPYRDLIGFVRDRPGHDARYAIDPTKIQRDLGFVAKTSFGAALDATVEWYLKKYRPGATA